jgi:hypothetical protein
MNEIRDLANFFYPVSSTIPSYASKLPVEDAQPFHWVDINNQYTDIGKRNTILELFSFRNYPNPALQL